MRISTVFSAIFFGLTAFAAPTRPGHPSREVSNATTTMTARGSLIDTIFPETQVVWREDAPDSFGDVTQGVISAKSGRHLVSTAVNLKIPHKYDNLTCKLVFRLKSTDTLVWVDNGNRKSSFDLHHIARCVNKRNSWNSHNPRTIKLATVTPRFEDDAEWQWTTDLPTDLPTDAWLPKLSAASTFSCAGGEYAFEMAPHGNDASISWSQVNPNVASGLTIEVFEETFTGK